jgi:phosphoribosylamine-glycine ligase
MKVMVIGHGAREHAICEAVRKSAELYAIMKSLNPGIARLAKKYKFSDEEDGREIANWALAQGIELALIGPEGPEAAGVANELESEGIKVASPTNEATQIETSKAFMRELLQRHKIGANPRFGIFESAKEAGKFIQELDCKVAIKPIGLTGGKGVRVYPEHFNSIEGALRRVEEVINKKIGSFPKVLIEEKMEGEEFTLQAFCDGKRLLPTPLVQDHKRLLEGDNGPNCYSADTHILTEEGWKRFNELNPDIKVAVVDPNSREIWFERPQKRYWRDYSGNMIQFKNRNLDLLVTPNHRMLVQQRKGKHKKTVVKAKDYKGEYWIYQAGKWKGKNKDFFTLPGYDYRFNRKFKELKINFAHQWTRFLGIYLAEGNSTKDKLAPSANRVYIAQSKKFRNFDAIKQILDKLPFNFTYEESGHRFRINSIQLATYLKRFGASHEKYVPDYIKNSKPEIMLDFLKAFNLGDGDIHRGKLRFCSSSKRLIDDIQEMLIKLDYSGIITIDKRKTMVNPLNKKRYKATPIYSIEKKERNRTSIRKYNKKVVKYKGKIGCVTVSTGFIVVRRNNRVTIAGNTGGMGSYSQADGLLPFVTKNEREESLEILQQIINGLDKESIRYKGAIYGQFMLTNEGPKVTEINARWGDPENMNVLPLLDSDFVDLCLGMAEGNLSKRKAEFEPKATVCKYLVPPGYGINPKGGKEIKVNEPKISEERAKLFYASVNQRNGKLFTTTSRALALLGIANSIEEAEQIAERGSKWVKGKLFMRHDIGKKELIEKKIKYMLVLRGK